MLTQASDVLSRVETVVGTVASVVSTANKVVDTAVKHVPAGGFLKRRAVNALTARLAWGAVPLVGAGLAYWGYRTWKRRAERTQAAAFPQPPIKDVPAPRDKVDESSWESFPASDPPAFSPSSSAAKPRPVAR